MTLPEFDAHFRTWLLDTYHHRFQKRLHGTPLARWQEGKWLPRPPKSENDLDLLLLCEGTTRQVNQEGIRFQGHWYLDVKLAGYVRSTVRIYYDPADLRAITVYSPDGIIGGQFLCQARCQDLEEQKVSLKEVVAARTQRRKELQTQMHELRRVARQARATLSPKPLTRGISSRKALARGTEAEKAPMPGEHAGASQSRAPLVSRFKAPRFMAQISPEFVQEVAPSQESGTRATSEAQAPTRALSSAKAPVHVEPSDGGQRRAPPASGFKPPRFMAQLSSDFVQNE
jgi:hypothetical protein